VNRDANHRYESILTPAATCQVTYCILLQYVAPMEQKQPVTSLYAQRALIHFGSRNTKAFQFHDHGCHRSIRYFICVYRFFT